MGKYFDGKRINYIKTGATELSRDAIKRISKAEERAKNKRKLEKRVKKNKETILGGHLDFRHRLHNNTNVLNFLRSKLADKYPRSTKVKKKTTRKKKATKWQKLVNGVKARSIRSFTALENRAKRLYRFLDDV